MRVCVNVYARVLHVFRKYNHGALYTVKMYIPIKM